MNKTLTLTLAATGFLQICYSAAKAESEQVNRDSAAYYINLSKEDLAARKVNDAWIHLDKAAKYDPRNADIYLAIADVCRKLNRMAPSVKALETAASLLPTDYSIQWKLVQIYFNYGQYGKVIDLLPALHEHMQETKGWAFMLGMSYYSIPLRNTGKAMAYLEMSLKEDPANGEAAYLIGHMNAGMENYAAAIPYYQRALSMDSTSQPIRTYELAIILYNARQFDASVKAFQKAIDRGWTTNDEFFKNQAYAKIDAGMSVEAIDMLKEMLRRRPKDLGLLEDLADISVRSGQYKEAINYYDMSLEIRGISDKKARANTLYQMGQAYKKMGNEKDGNQLCEEAIRLSPSLNVLKQVRTMSL